MRVWSALLFSLACAGTARAQWTPQRSDTTGEFRGLVAVSTSVAWASGTRGRVARTTDGGNSWTVDTVAGATRLDFRDIHALSATTAWAMSDPVPNVSSSGCATATSQRSPAATSWIGSRPLTRR